MYDDLDGRVCVVTGASGGIGAQIARNLLACGARVVLACRDIQGGRDVVGEHERAEVEAVDLSSLTAIRDFAGRVLGRHPRIDVLVCNAAVYPPVRAVSADGLELTWATNVLGYFLTANLLEPALRAARGRIIDVVSLLAGGLDTSDLMFERRRWDGIAAYKQSKQANRMLAWARAERLAASGVTVNAVHPGSVRTGIARHQRGVWGAAVRALGLVATRSVRHGADTATWLASSQEIAGRTGALWVRRRERPCEFRELDACRALWRMCEAQVG